MRRRFQTILSIVALSLCMASTIFLVVTAENLGFGIALVVRAQLGNGFAGLFSGFGSVIGFMGILTSALITYFLVSTSMSQRTGDIGIMKAVGGLTQVAFGYFAIELSIMVLASGVIGIGLGVLLSYLYVNVEGFVLPITQFHINPWAILLIFSIFVFASHFMGILPIVKALEVKPAEALLSQYLRGVTFKSGMAPTTKLGLSFKMAYRTLLRRRSATLMTIICLAAVLTSTTLMVTGGTVANQTTQSYLKRAIGNNVVLIAHPDLSERYLDLLSHLLHNKEVATINYSDPKYVVPEPLVSRLKNVSGVVKVDSRFIFETEVHEVPFIYVEDRRYFQVGDRRSGEALIVGVDPENVVNEWLVSGRVLDEDDLYSALVGDSLASQILTVPSEQKLRIFGKTFEVAGLILDPLNEGIVVYIPSSILSEVIGPAKSNLLLLRLDQLRGPETMEDIVKAISGSMLDVVELDGAVERYVALFDSLWSSVMILSILFLAAATICLFGYMMLCLHEQLQEIGIMRALGAKPSLVLKIVSAQVLLIVSSSAAIGIPIGFFAAFSLLLPDPTVSLGNVVQILAWLFLALVVLCLSGLYPVFKAVNKSIINTMSHPSN